MEEAGGTGEMSLSRVPGNDELYVSGIFTLSRKATLASTGITHIVSVLKFDSTELAEGKTYSHLGIEVDDVEDENLLGEFERSGAFIEDALRNGRDGKQGRVLIHCAMGRSRSVSICAAYLLRQYAHLTVASALSQIRETRPMAEPNSGFMAQLALYKEMGCPKNIDHHPKYQRWLYQKEVRLAIAAGMAPENVRFEDEEVSDANNAGEGNRQVELRCRKCRKTLATTSYLITHLPPSPNISSYSDAQPPPPVSTLHTHHFLSPLSWMRPTLSQGLLSGRLECPNSKCSAQIGRYAWQGMKCNCGSWVCPAFSLAKKSVDEISLPHSVIGSKTGSRVGGP